MPDVDHYSRWFQTLVPRASKTARPHIPDTGNGVRSRDAMLPQFNFGRAWLLR